MARRFEEYKVKRGDNLGSPDFWDRRFEDLDVRLHARELDGGRMADAADQLIQVGLTRLNDTMTPLIDRALERLNSFGVLFQATSMSSVTIGMTEKTFVVDMADRGGYVPTDYLSIRPDADANIGIIAQYVSFDRETGVLVVLPVLTAGSGTYDHWVINITGQPDLDHSTRTDNPHSTTAAQVGA